MKWILLFIIEILLLLASYYFYIIGQMLCSILMSIPSIVLGINILIKLTRE